MLRPNDSETLDVLIQEATGLGRKGDWGPEAARLNTKILAQDPTNLAALIRRGRCHLEQDDYPAAREDYARALEIDPSNRAACSGLVRVHQGWDRAVTRASKRAQREREQEEELRKVAATTSFRQARRWGISACERRPPSYEVAIAAFRKAYQLDPSRRLRPGEHPPAELFEVPTRLAGVYRRTGRLDEAQRVYEWILRHRDSVHAKVGLAAVYEDRHKHKMARQLYDEALERDPNDPAALRGLARTLSSLDRGDEAARSYWRASGHE